VSDGNRAVHAVSIDGLEAELAASRTELRRLREENRELKAIVAEVQKALDAAEADVARYRALFEAGRPNVPERVASKEQQLALAGVIESLAAVQQATTAENDTSAKPREDEAAATGNAVAQTTSGPPKPPPRPNKPRKNSKPLLRDRHGRRKLDLSSLPERREVLDPPEVLASSGVGFRLVGEETSDRIVFVPSSFVRLHLVRRKWVRIDQFADRLESETSSPPDAEFLIAPIPDALTPNAMADASAVAHAVVSKYDDLSPLNRQEKISRREGFRIPRSTLCNWFAPSYAVLCGIVDAMFLDAKARSHLATDATGAKVRPSTKSASENWHLFVFVAEKAHVVFRHAREHDSIRLQQMLHGFRGTLLGDAASIYSPLVTAGMIVLACCWAHVRRYFFKALDSDRSRALEAIAIIGQLFDIERDCKHLSGTQKVKERADRAGPVLKLFDDWLDRERPRVDPRSAIHRAITYATNQREELRRFLVDGHLRIDNNICEGLLRSLVLGLNNWRYFETETGLKWYATFRSLIASCHMHGLCPERYLECVLRLAPHWSQRRLLELSPMHWRATVATLTPAQIAIVRPPWSTAFDAFAPDIEKTATQSIIDDAA